MKSVMRAPCRPSWQYRLAQLQKTLGLCDIIANRSKGGNSRTCKRERRRIMTGCACASGPVFAIGVTDKGAPLPLAQAYPSALLVLKRIARRIAE